MALKKQPCQNGRDDYGYRSLSATVIKLAAEDLEQAYKKLLKLERLNRENKLKSFIQKNKKKPETFRFTNDEESAIRFFKQEQKDSLYPLYAEMIDFGMPVKIKRMIAALEARKREVERVVRREQDKIEIFGG